MIPTSPASQNANFLFKITAGFKLASLLLVSFVLFFSQNIYLLSGFCLFAIILYFLAGFKWPKIASTLLTPFILACLLGLFQFFASGMTLALIASCRLFALLSLASFVSATTQTAAFLAIIEKSFSYLAPLGLNPRKAALAIGLTIRFIPMVKQSFHEARTAHIARCGNSKLRLNNIGTLFSLMLTRLVVAQEEIAQAIEARGFEEQK